jgi:hypothetical protein
VQLGTLLLVVSHALPQPPQLLVVVIEVSQPLVFGAAVLQSAYPLAQPPRYVQEPPTHCAPALVSVSQALPHPPQLVGVVVGVSQPSRSGAAALQSA